MKSKFGLNLEMMVRNFYFFTIFAIAIGGVTYYGVRGVEKEVLSLKNNYLPLLILSQEMQQNIEETSQKVEELFIAEIPEARATYLDAIEKNRTAFNRSLDKALNYAAIDEVAQLKELEAKSKVFFKLLAEPEIRRDEVAKSLSRVRSSFNAFKGRSLQSIQEKFTASESATGRALLIVILLTLLGAAGLILLAVILSKAVGAPVSLETEKLVKNSKDIETVFAEINQGTRKQTDVVQMATAELEDMIINIIQGNISLSVDKQAEISRTFAEFLKHFVERTSVEIAMGMMSISQQSLDARKSVEDFVREVSNVEANIKAQEAAVSGMADALKSIVEANKDIKGKLFSSTEAADKATVVAFTGQDRISRISEELQEIRSSSVGVKEIADSLAKITESIKILALNMSLKVEDIKDDTGKTYGFEAMSAKVQKLAEEVESLLEKSKSMIIPTIQGIEKVSLDAGQTRDLIADVVKSIKIADDQGKAIASQIDKQASDIDRVEVEAENLRTLARNTTLAVEAQAALTRDVDSLLNDSVSLIESVNGQTMEASEGARKVNSMMEQLKKTVSSIEEGTGRLTEKSSQIADMFDMIRELAVNNMKGAEKLEGVTSSVRDVSSKLSAVVKGKAA